MTLFSQFKRDRRGVAAMEFALVGPVLVVAYLGLAELSSGITASRRVSHVAWVLGDLVAQAQTTSSSEINDLLGISPTLLSPLSSANLKVRLSSVTVNSANTPIVDWSQASGEASYTKGQTVVLPKSAGNASLPFLAAGQSVVLVEVEYPWTSPTGDFIPISKTFTENAYVLPRQGAAVSCTDC